MTRFQSPKDARRGKRTVVLENVTKEIMQNKNFLGGGGNPENDGNKKNHRDGVGPFKTFRVTSGGKGGLGGEGLKLDKIKKKKVLS